MSRPRLTIVTRSQGNNLALKDARITPSGFELQFQEVPVLVDAFRRMVRGLEFDICEMALTTYLCAREHGAAFTALPIFLVRGFHHGAIHTRAAGDLQPSDLVGHAVGVNRGYTVTTGVWARAILQEEYGVDLGRITWALSGDEHVEAYQPPSNVMHLEPGTDLAAMVASGELPAAVNIKADRDDLRTLIPDPDATAMRAVVERGFYPINHLIVVRDEVLHAHPGLAPALFDAFTAAKNEYVAQLGSAGSGPMNAQDRLYATVRDATGADPLPYGLDANREVLESLLGHAVGQGILRRFPALDEVFAPIDA